MNTNACSTLVHRHTEERGLEEEQQQPEDVERRPFVWAALPLEIRFIVLTSITEIKNPGWATAAAVCKEWNSVIARHNMYHITLHGEQCVEQIGRVQQTTSQRDLVHRIILDVRVPPYECHCFATTWSIIPGTTTGASYSGAATAKRTLLPWARDCSTRITMATRRLFEVLSTWRPMPREVGRGRVLEISTHTPGDRQHYFRNFYFTGTDGDAEANINNNSNSSGSSSSSSSSSSNLDTQLRHSARGMLRGHQEHWPPRAAVARLFYHGSLTAEAPRARTNAVASLMISRQLRRTRSLPVAGIVSRMVGLEKFIYESWREWRHALRGEADNEYFALIRGLPRTVRSVILFEDFDERLLVILHSRNNYADEYNYDYEFGDYHADNDDDDNDKEEEEKKRQAALLVRTVDPRVGKMLAARSVELDELVVSFAAGAEHFFQTCTHLISADRSLAWNEVEEEVVVTTTLDAPRPRMLAAIPKEIPGIAHWSRLRAVVLTSQLLQPPPPPPPPTPSSARFTLGDSMFGVSIATADGSANYHADQAQLRRRRHLAAIDNMLERAGRVAMHMPQLKLLVIWFGGRHQLGERSRPYRAPPAAWGRPTWTQTTTAQDAMTAQWTQRTQETTQSPQSTQWIRETQATATSAAELAAARSHAAAFIYEVRKGKANGDGSCTPNMAFLTVRGTWPVPLADRVVDVWEQVGIAHGAPALRTERQMFRAAIYSHGDAIHYLHLPCHVVSPRSLWQMRMEGRSGLGWPGHW